MQTSHFKSSKFLLAFVVFFITFSACKKDPVVTPTPVPVPVPDTRELTILFSGQTLPATDIDSVVAVVRDKDQWIKKSKTFDKAQSSFKVNLQDLPAGNYTAEILVFSKKRPDLTARQFRSIQTLVLPLAAGVVLQGPTGHFNDAWYQRAVFFHGQRDAIFIVAMDPRDSYYEVSLKNTIGKNIHLQREAIDGNVLAAAKSISRDIDGAIGLSDYADFIPYLTNMQNKSWTKAVISGWLEKKDGGAIDFTYEYNNN